MSSWRHLLPMLMLVTFALQSYVTQTHFHFDGHIATGGVVSDVAKTDVAKIGTKSGDRDKYPADDDRANCPICQEMLYAGHYVMPAAIPVLLPSLPISTIAVVTDVPIHIFAPSHPWHGRAPPRI